MPDQPPHLPPAVIDAIRHGNKIEAIKILREVRLSGLKEAKDEVDAYVKAHPEISNHQARSPIETGRSWLTWLAVLAAGALLGYFYYRR